MRYLVVYAHPVDDSFVAALHRCVVKTLREAGHTVDDCDLNAEGFQPVLSEAERRAYHDVRANRASVAKEIERLTRCEGLVFVYPTWWYGMPAILKEQFGLGQGKAGESLEFHVAHVWELRDEKLLRGTVYLDPEAALDAVEAATG